MKNFLVLYMADPADYRQAMASATPEQQKAAMAGWMAWMTKTKASIVDDGAPLGKTKRVDRNGAKDAQNGVGGYSVLQAASHDAVVALIGKDHPHLQSMPGAWVEITEILPMPGA